MNVPPYLVIQSMQVPLFLDAINSYSRCSDVRSRSMRRGLRSAVNGPNSCVHTAPSCAVSPLQTSEGAHYTGGRYRILDLDLRALRGIHLPILASDIRLWRCSPRASVVALLAMLLGGCSTLAPAARPSIYGDADYVIDSELGLPTDDNKYSDNEATYGYVPAAVTLKEVRSAAAECWKSELAIAGANPAIDTASPFLARGVEEASDVCSRRYRGLFMLGAQITDQACARYIDQLASLQTDYKEGADLVNALGGAASALLGLLRAGSVVTGAVGAGASLLDATINKTAQNYLFTIEAGQIRALVSGKATAFRTENAIIADYPHAEQLLVQYFSICTPATIKSMVGDVITQAASTQRPFLGTPSAIADAVTDAFLNSMQEEIGALLNDGSPLSRASLVAVYVVQVGTAAKGVREQALEHLKQRSLWTDNDFKYANGGSATTKSKFGKKVQRLQIASTTLNVFAAQLFPPVDGKEATEAPVAAPTETTKSNPAVFELR